ncbi:uncharacterized protein LOC127718336 [Mytilus californianus]|uniref:uncharacterized protein LOC127718336 n=1 Tax=Mytilus californianus TaxID=6549 RepID=UPI00224673CE|nr:uncharacterized protein LOC127718336 [Mytilus californianus]
METFMKVKGIALPNKNKKFVDNSNSLLGHTSIRDRIWDEDLHDEDSINKFKEFSSGLLSLDEIELTNVCNALDFEQCVSVDDPKTTEIVTSIECFITSLLRKVGEIDARFKSSLIKGGSFYDGTKIGEIDEFDFVARIDSLSKEGVLEAREAKQKKGFVFLAVKDRKTLKEFEDFINTDGVISVQMFKEHFSDLLFSALSEIEIPENIIPSSRFNSGDEYDDDWVPLRHGPCAKLDLTYICNTTPDIVEIDIDIAPGIAFPNKMYIPPVLEKLTHLHPNEFLQTLKELCDKEEICVVPFDFDTTEKIGESSWTYKYSDTWRISFSSIEKAVFSLYSHKSTEKTLYRLLKILKEFHFQQSDDVIEKSGSKHLKGNEPPRTIMSTSGLTIQPLFSRGDDEEGESKESENQEVDFKERFCVESVFQKTKHEANDYEVAYGDNIQENTISVKDLIVCPKEQMKTPARYVDKNDKISIKTSEVNKSSNISLNTRVATPSENQESRYKEYKPKRPNHSDQKMECTNNGTSTQSVDEHNSDGTSFPDKINLICGINQRTSDLHDNEGLTEPGSSVGCCMQTTSFECLQNYSTSSNISKINDIEILYLREKASDVVSEDLFDSKTEPGTLISQTTTFGDTLKILKYRESLPLFKTYYLKMLFLAMKTAYPRDDDWTEDKLCSLVISALQMLYYAFSSKQKGFLNYWFQDYVENRTRESTSIEILFCLQETLTMFRNLQGVQ